MSRPGVLMRLPRRPQWSYFASHPEPISNTHSIVDLERNGRFGRAQRLERIDALPVIWATRPTEASGQSSLQP
jgi:hypothetical protein